jgi:ribosomal protein L32
MKGRKRRTHYVTAVPTVTACPACFAAIRPHTVCPACGEYRQRRYLTKAKTE